MTSIIAVVPALNEAATIESVVRSALQQVDKVCVVDDGSTDRTGDIARAAGAHVIRHESNQGVGAAVAAGLAWAREQHADAAVQLDGDGQHDAGHVPALLAALGNGADLVIGTRFELGFEMSGVRRLAMRAFSSLISRRLGHRLDDPTSGFRAFSPRAIDVLVPIFPRKYLSDTVEVLYLASDAGLRVSSTPVKMHQRRGGQPSVGPLKSTVYALRMFSIIGRHILRRSP